MRSFVMAYRKLCAWMNSIAGLILFFMMGLTVSDVVLRFFNKPITGSYELMAISGLIVIGGALPKTTIDKGHICVDLLVEHTSPKAQNVLFLLTRIPNLALFATLSFYLICKARALYQSKEISLILGIPNYLLVYVLAFCCIIECGAFVTNALQTFVEAEVEGRAK